jgi:hypothetical protein
VILSERQKNDLKEEENGGLDLRRERERPVVSMSSEKFELNQDDLDSLLERVGAALRQLAPSQGEARKRTQQVRYTS